MSAPALVFMSALASCDLGEERGPEYMEPFTELVSVGPLWCVCVCVHCVGPRDRNPVIRAARQALLSAGPSQHLSSPGCSFQNDFGPQGLTRAVPAGPHPPPSPSSHF